ncbi:hypothetical protein Ahy_B04g071506 [Arachis hypogaea]|uniref:Aminotransferase-like plant mobile domain-containing protein n=1 Tax=Arachis hypogaea TaxID=3818 RepID=A0A444ZKV2_ARAHY|nr:hypothetical protein Ahy_B04g071506 [Arachis hypogaea]
MWTVKLTWFHQTVCGELEQDAIGECLLWYTRRYIMQLIGDILFLNASDSRVRIRWLALLEDLDRCGGLSWGSAVLVDALVCYSLEPITIFRCYGPMDLILVDFRLWVEYRPDNARGEHRFRHYRYTLNGIGILNVDWMLYADPQLHGLVPPGIAEAEASAVVVVGLYVSLVACSTFRPDPSLSTRCIGTMVSSGEASGSRISWVADMRCGMLLPTINSTSTII